MPCNIIYVNRSRFKVSIKDDLIFFSPKDYDGEYRSFNGPITYDFSGNELSFPLKTKEDRYLSAETKKKVSATLRDYVLELTIGDVKEIHMEEIKDKITDRRDTIARAQRELSDAQGELNRLLVEDGI